MPKGRCPQCGHWFWVDRPRLVCPVCGAAVRIRRPAPVKSGTSAAPLAPAAVHRPEADGRRKRRKGYLIAMLVLGGLSLGILGFFRQFGEHFTVPLLGPPLEKLEYVAGNAERFANQRVRSYAYPGGLLIGAPGVWAFGSAPFDQRVCLKVPEEIGKQINRVQLRMGDQYPFEIEYVIYPKPGGIVIGEIVAVRVPREP